MKQLMARTFDQIKKKGASDYNLKKQTCKAYVAFTVFPQLK